MSLMNERAFYRLWARKTFNPALRVTGIVSLVVGILAGFLSSRWPALNVLGTQLRWILPASVFLIFLLYRMVRAPFEVLHDLDVTRESAEDQLREKRGCQSIADELTKEFHYGVHQLLNRPPTTSEERKEWQRAANNWTQGILHRMKQFGCTPQELNHVETIAFSELAGIPDVAFAPDLKMHEIRLSRVADVSTKYAKRAEELITRSP